MRHTGVTVCSEANPGVLSLLSLHEAAALLSVSGSWIRRHLHELPHKRHGCLIRFDRNALLATLESRKSLKPERTTTMVNRYQRGGVYLRRGKKGDVWYGTWRYDLEGTRHSKKFRLGTRQELPTKNAARKRLDELVNGKP